MLDVRREETSVDRSDGEINAICCGGWRDEQDRVGVLGREGERERERWVSGAKGRGESVT
jgi:hypothetical protein